MSATDAFENKILSLYFENIAAADIGNAGGLQPSSVAGSVFIGLHVSDPGEVGDQTTNETGYTNYGTRPGVARSTAGWSIASGVASNDAAITFPTCGATGATISHVGIGSAATAAGTRDMNGTASLVVSTGITPQFAIAALEITLT